MVAKPATAARAMTTELRSHDAGTVTAAARMLLRVASKVSSTCSDLGMTPGQYRFMMVVFHEPSRAQHVAEQLMISRPAVTQQVDALETKGWMTRVVTPEDKRGRSVTITPAGRAALRRVELSIEELLGELVGPDDLAALAGALEAVDRGLQRETDRMTQPTEPAAP